MAKKDNLVIGLVLSILLLVGSVAALGATGNLTLSALSATTSDKPFPLSVASFDTASCQAGASDIVEELDMSNARYDSGEEYHVAEFICGFNTNKCKLTYSQSSRTINRAYVCTVPFDTDADDVVNDPASFSGCQRISQTGTTQQLEFNFNRNSNFHQNEEKIIVLARGHKTFFIFGDRKVDSDIVSIEVEAAIYNLKSVDGVTDYTTTTRGSCKIVDIGRAGVILTKDIQALQQAGKISEFGDVFFEESVNIVNGAVRIEGEEFTKNVIQYKDEWVYVAQIGEIWEIKQANNGEFYTTDLFKVNAPDIVCKPSSPYCSDDGTNTGLSEGTCTLFGGRFAGPAPTPDNTQICDWTCVNGQLETIGDTCVNVIDCGTGEVFDINDGQCKVIGVSLVNPIPIESNFFLNSLLAIGAVGLIGTSAFAIALAIEPKKRKKK